jgi:hypothetical protein
MTETETPLRTLYAMQMFVFNNGNLWLFLNWEVTWVTVGFHNDGAGVGM